MPEDDLIQITVKQEHYPRYDPSHGTPDPMVRRVLALRLPQGGATFEQTDYGHRGRFNDWEPRGIDPKLQPRTVDLLAICRAITPLLEA